jgi:micrococcal nuclease
MSRPTRTPTRRLSFRRRRGALVAILFAILIAVRVWQDRQNPPPPESLAEGIHAVERVVDGDTLLLANRARVRLIGVDAPETVKPDHPVEPFGPEAAEFTRRFVGEADNLVQLQFDRERVDRYGRFLAYVWVDDRMLNEELIRAGLATAETGFRYQQAMKTRFRRAEDEAKAAGRGIWSRQPVPASL